MGQSRDGSELYLKQADGSFVKKEQKYFLMLSSFRLRIWALFWMLIPMGTLIFMSHPVDMILRFAHFIFDGYF